MNDTLDDYQCSWGRKLSSSSGRGRRWLRRCDRFGTFLLVTSRLLFEFWFARVRDVQCICFIILWRGDNGLKTLRSSDNFWGYLVILEYFGTGKRDWVGKLSNWKVLVDWGRCIFKITIVCIISLRFFAFIRWWHRCSGRTCC